MLGVDFDNTLVDYADIFEEIGERLGLCEGSRTKDAVRSHLRLSGRDGEWTSLQCEVYGRSMHRARLYPGAAECLDAARRCGAGVVVISHKSSRAAADPSVDLRRSALDWLARQPVHVDAVYFEETRAEKIARIQDVGCTHFIDDLPEVFSDPLFPIDAERWLFLPSGAGSIDGCHVFTTWSELREELFVNRA